MDMNEKQQWYTRINILESRSLDLSCPRCGNPYPIGPLFDHDPRQCLYCGGLLIEWNMTHHIYVIDVDRAPDIVKALIKYLSPLTEPEAAGQLLILLRFLGIDQS